QVYYYVNSTFVYVGAFAAGSYYLRIIKSGNILAGYYKKNLSDSWTLIYSTAIAAAASSIDVGMGNGGGAIGTGAADYDYFRISPYMNQATWTSNAKDLSRTPTTQGVISWLQDAPEGTNISLQTATSNDGVNWSPWSQIYGD